MTKEPEAGEYWYVTLEYKDDKYEDKFIKLIKIISNMKFHNQESVIGYVSVYSEYHGITFVNNIKHARLIWIKQWKPNWFYRMIGY